jgi:hypothetical protein
MKAISSLNSASSTSPLPSVRERNPFRLQSRHVGQRLEGRHLDFARVHDVNDVVDGDRRFADVSRKNDLAAADRGLVEDGSLFPHVDQRMQKVDVGVVEQVHVVESMSLKTKFKMITFNNDFR